jgi:hypothetical protein
VGTQMDAGEVGCDNYPAVIDAFEASMLKFCRIVTDDYRASKMGIVLEKTGTELFNWSACPPARPPWSPCLLSVLIKRAYYFGCAGHCTGLCATSRK